MFVVGKGIWNNFKIHLLPFESLRGTIAVGEEKASYGKTTEKKAKTEVVNLFSQKDWYDETCQLCYTLKNIGITLGQSQEAKLYLMSSRIAFLK